MIGITGASGSILALKIITELSKVDAEVNIVATESGEKVFRFETGQNLENFTNGLKDRPSKLRLIDNKDMFSGIASGSYGVDVMAIVPCSMATAGKIATCSGEGLLCRASDVCLKEGAKLVVVPRETPMHSVHLQNLLTLSTMGATIVPPVPIFYAKPSTYDEAIDGIAGRILKAMGVESSLLRKWGGTDD